MTDNRSKTVIEVCNSSRSTAKNIETNCHNVCPLSSACKPRRGDTKSAYDERMNSAAENIEVTA